jgi:hypothetical protein
MAIEQWDDALLRHFQEYLTPLPRPVADLNSDEAAEAELRRIEAERKPKRCTARVRFPGGSTVVIAGLCEVLQALTCSKCGQRIGKISLVEHCEECGRARIALARIRRKETK